MSQVQLLYRLQQIDTEIQEKKQRLGDVLRAQKESEALVAARQHAQTAASELQKWQTHHKDLSLELEGINNKAQRSENRLYSGKVKNPKELADLQKEVEVLGRRREELEDEVLEAMIMIEEAETEKAAADEALAQIKTKWEQKQASLKQEQNELALHIHELTGNRQELLPRIPPETLAQYEDIRQRRGGVAVARVRANMCLGCRTTLPAHQVKEVREGKMVFCGNCGRILSPA